jgi:ABC-type amino acid transport substrate-binding protein
MHTWCSILKRHGHYKNREEDFMQIRTLHIATGIASAMLLASVAQADTLSKIRASQTITLATRDASIPFSYLDENKKPIGYSVDLCLKIAEAVKRELKLPKLDIVYLSVTPTTRIPAIIEGKADLECGSTTNTAERRKTVAFTIPHFVAATRMLVRTDKGIKNWQDLRERPIVATKGTTAYKMTLQRDQSHTLNFKVTEANDHAESFGKVERGEADAFPMDDVLLYGFRAKSKNPSAFSIVGDPLSTEPYAVMLRRDDAPFKAVVDREVARIIHDGELVKMYDKWFQKPIPPTNINLNMPMSFLLRESLRFPTDKVADE